MKINATKAKKLIDKGATIVDIRSPVDFAAGNFPNAVNVPLRNISQLMRFDRKNPIVFIGNDDTDSELEQALNYATQMGLVAYSVGGLKNLE